MHPLPPRGRVPGIQTLLVQLVLAIYVPALLAAIVLVVLETRNTRVVTEGNQLDRTVLLSRELRLHVEAIQLHLARLAEEVYDDGGDWSAFDRSARATAAAAGLDAVVLMRPDGRQVVNTRVDPGMPLPTHSPEALLRSARTGKPNLSDVFPSPISGRPAVCVSIPVIRDGRVLYGLSGGLEVERLQELLSATPEGWIAAIVDARGVIVARTPQPQQFVGRTITPEFSRQIHSEEQGIFKSVTLDGVPVLTAFRTPPSIGWTVVMSVPEGTLHAPAWKKAVYLGTGAAALLALGLWLAMRLRRDIVRSVNALVDEAVHPLGPPPAPVLAFREANRVRMRLHDNAISLVRAQREVERTHADFQRALVQQMDRRQAAIAAELHDHVGSTLAGVSLVMAQLDAQLPPAGRSLLARAHSQLDRAIGSLRQISRGIMPAGEQQGALPAALDQLADDAARTGTRCTFHVRGDFSRLSPETAGHLYRIAQEAVTNALRHAGTTRIRVMLSRNAQRARLTVDDDGSGFRMAELRSHPGIGLKSMRTRTMAMEGQIELGRSALGGARVRVTFALPLQGGQTLAEAPETEPA